MDRTKCSLSDSELIEKVQDELSKMCQTGGKSFTMRIPAKVNEDTDLLISEMVARFKELSVKTVNLDAVVREKIAEIMDGMINGDNGHGQTHIIRVSALEEAKGKLTEEYYGV